MNTSYCRLYGPFAKLEVDLALDDLCNLCGAYYCKDCNRPCVAEFIERCEKVPCLSCEVHKVRLHLGIAVPGTNG